MTRLYTEADVRAMLADAAYAGNKIAASPLSTQARNRIAARILSTATPVAAPDLSRLAPVQPSKGIPFPTSVPWHIYLRAHSQYEAFGQRQSAERLAERGGFDAEELVTLLCGRDPYKYEHQPPSAEEVERCRRECEPTAPDLSRLAEAVLRGIAWERDGGRAGYEAVAAERLAREVFAADRKEQP